MNKVTHCLHSNITGSYFMAPFPAIISLIKEISQHQELRNRGFNIWWECLGFKQLG